ncbi:MAG TPA: DUF885 domain-containing protein, partial [Dehalococcoidia bacterium]|nr:DUF885 domain-containing protein [Dehalococcoidia bacterium]
PPMSRIFDIANNYVEDLAALDPNFATSIGVPGHETELTDYSPEGWAKLADLNRRTLPEVEATEPEGEHDRIARDVMVERMRVRYDLYEAGEYLRDVKIIGSGMSAVRSVFDQMPRATEQDWRHIAGRLMAVPGALAGYRASLSKGLAEAKVAAKRQALQCAGQAETWSGLKAGTPSFFSTLVDAFDGGGVNTDGLRADLERGVRGAEQAYAELRSFLLDTYLPKAAERDGAGRERYALNSRVFNGAELDLEETYRWGWDELYRVEAELDATADKIQPGATVAEALKLLETDPARSLDSAEAFQSWLQELHDQALDDLDGTHFDIDPRIKRVEVMIPPPGGALAPYYTGPSEDFTRPGRTWWPLGTRTRFPKWFQVTTAYHEGVPGHHLQVGAVRCFSDRLSRYQRTAAFVSGHGEGWALYAERLMGELGYLQNPDYELGMLSAQAMRCVRVIVDIGMHLELPIPATDRFHPGETWNHDLALEFAVERSLQPREFMASEIIRYLGWPAQAISYKVGERAWLAAREAAKKREGAAFDLKAFHTKALMLGPMGLAQLEKEMAR